MRRRFVARLDYVMDSRRVVREPSLMIEGLTDAASKHEGSSKASLLGTFFGQGSMLCVICVLFV